MITGKNLHTRFIQFLMGSEKSNLNQFNDETDMDEVDGNEDTIDADEIIERLVLKLKKSNKEFDDIIYGRKRK